MEELETILDIILSLGVGTRPLVRHANERVCAPGAREAWHACHGFCTSRFDRLWNIHSINRFLTS